MIEGVPEFIFEYALNSIAIANIGSPEPSVTHGSVVAVASQVWVLLKPVQVEVTKWSSSSAPATIKSPSTKGWSGHNMINQAGRTKAHPLGYHVISQPCS